MSLWLEDHVIIEINIQFRVNLFRVRLLIKKSKHNRVSFITQFPDFLIETSVNLISLTFLLHDIVRYIVPSWGHFVPKLVPLTPQLNN